MGHDAYAAIREANYRWFAGGFACSSTGLQMLSMAVGWEVYERTQSATHLGYVGLARALPVVALALPAGRLLDLCDRRAVLVGSQAGFTLCAGLLAWWSWASGPLWVMYLLLVASGCCRSLNGPSRSALLPLIVPRGVFTNAIAWNTGVFQVSGLAGPLLGGWVIHQTGAAWWVYALTAAATGVFAISAWFIKPLEAQRPSGRFTLESMVSGLGYVRRERTLFGAILVDCLGVLLGGASALLPIYAKEILHVGPEGLGALRAAPFVGALFVAIYLAHRPPFARTGVVFLWSVAIWAGLTVAFGLSTSFWLSLVLLAAQGAADGVSVVIRHVLVQFRTPDELRGRVSAVNSMFIEISNEMGGFESGMVAALGGAVFSVVSGGLGALGVVGLVAWKIPELRRLGALVEPHGAGKA